MTLQEFMRDGLLNAMANTFDNERSAHPLLLGLGFEPGQIPAWGAAETAQQWWQTVVRQIDNGIVPGGLDGLIRAAVNVYPHHPVLAPAARRLSPPVDPMDRRDTGTSLLVTGESSVAEILGAARAVAARLGVGPVELGFVNPSIAQLRFPDANPEQVHSVSQTLEEQRLAERTIVVPNQFRDYLLRRLFVEGPDQGRYELSDIPASTRVKDIARAMTNEYYGENWPRDGQGKRPAVVDLDEATGAHRRLNPESTLHDSGIEEDATLHVAPQATAGSVSPIVRDEALARVRSQVLAYKREHPGFEVLANAKTAPTEYVFHFTAPGWGPPSGPGSDPYPVDRHEVLVLLPSDFPMKAPGAFWQTPIFHPNVHRGTGKVCLGRLEEQYKPGLPFGEVCQLLVDIAAYRNYEIREGYDAEARNWALSPEGQMAIERRGGYSVTRLFLSMVDDHLREPLPMRIRRLDA